MNRLLGFGGAHVERHYQFDASFEIGAVQDGVVTCTVAGTAFQAMRVAATLDLSAALLSLRGGDGDGNAVAEAIDEAGIQDLSVTFLTRSSASRMALFDSTGRLVSAMLDDALYKRRFNSQVMRRGTRDAIAASAVLFVDECLGDAALARLVRHAGTKPIFAAAGSLAGVKGFSSQLHALKCFFFPCPQGMEAPDCVARLRAAGLESAVMADTAQIVAYDDSSAFAISLPALDNRSLRFEVPAIAGAATAALVAGASFADAVRQGLAAAILNQEAAQITPARLLAIAETIPAAQDIKVLR